MSAWSSQTPTSPQEIQNKKDSSENTAATSLRKLSFNPEHIPTVLVRCLRLEPFLSPPQGFSCPDELILLSLHLNILLFVSLPPLYRLDKLQTISTCPETPPRDWSVDPQTCSGDWGEPRWRWSEPSSSAVGVHRPQRRLCTFEMHAGCCELTLNCPLSFLIQPVVYHLQQPFTLSERHQGGRLK